MRIDRIEAYYVVLPLTYPWRTAYGEDADVHSVLVRMASGDHEGWGETCPLYAPTYSPDTATSAFFLIGELLAPMLVGQDIDSAEDLLGRLSQFKGNPFAKAGVESAWWTLHGSMVGQPLYALLGGTRRDVEAGADLGVQDSYDQLLAKIQAVVERGFKRLKLKVRPGWDLEMLQVVRPTYPDLTIHIDCNAGYTLDDLPFFKAVDKLELAMIEQPLFHRDLFEHAELQGQLQTPICLDESITSVRDFELALRLGSCRILNIKFARVGGLSTAVRLHNMARDAGMQCWVGGMLESAVGIGINIALATLPNFTYPNDLCEGRSFFRQGISEADDVLNPTCTFTPSAEPGTPRKPRLDRLASVTVRKVLVEA